MPFMGDVCEVWPCTRPQAWTTPMHSRLSTAEQEEHEELKSMKGTVGDERSVHHDCNRRSCQKLPESEIGARSRVREPLST